MDPNQLHGHFPLSKGTLVFIGMLMVFCAIVISIYLWYDLRLEQIEQSINHINTI